MALVECKECGGQVSDQAAACPHCGAPVVNDVLSPKVEAEPKLKTAKLVRKDEPVGAGCLVQLIGLLVIIFSFGWFIVEPLSGAVLIVVGGIFGLLILATGSTMAVKYRCTECGTKVEKSANECPGCSRRFI